MAEPITWRSINTPDFRSSTASLDSAARLFNGAFTGLQEQLKQREDTVDQNWKAGKEYNTNLFLDRLAQFQTPEEAQKALESGDLTNLRSQFGAQVDGAAIRAAQTNLVKGLQDRALSNLAYNDKTTEIKERPIVGQVSRLINEGKFAEARDLVNASGLREETKATLLGNAKMGERNEAEWGMKLLNQQQGNEEHESRMATEKLQRQKTLAELRAPKTPSMGDITAFTNLLTKAADNNIEAADATIKNSVFNGTPLTKGRGDLEKTLKDTGLDWFDFGVNRSNFIDEVINKASKGKDAEGKGDAPIISPDGKSLYITDSNNRAVTVPLTAELLDRAIRSKDGFMDSPSVNDVVSVLREYTQSPELQDAAGAYWDAKNKQNVTREGLAAGIANMISNAAGKVAPPKKPTNQR